MFAGFWNIFKIPELKRRMGFTLLMLAVYRIGAWVPTPGINAGELKKFIDAQSEGLLGFFDLFSGGALANMTVFTLGIMPYISASIILQLLTVVVPTLERLSKEGEAGRKKITQYTRYLTMGLSIVQAAGISLALENMEGGRMVLNPGWGFRIMTILTLTAGTAFIMWIGEQISERGIGNGISLIIYAGIIARLPNAILHTVQQISINQMQLYVLIVIAVVVWVVTASVVIMTQGQRKIPVQYARRVVGRRVYGGSSTHLPLRVNAAGVIPVIFASSLLMFPITIFGFANLDNYPYLMWLRDQLGFGQALHNILYVALIIFFTYFYTAIIFNPTDVADNMKKNGGFIPGIRPGKRTAEYIDKVLTRVTVFGAVFLAAVSVLPVFLIIWLQVPFYFGGTALLIVVGVGLDTMQQVESHLLMRHYDGFMKGGRLKGRR